MALKIDLTGPRGRIEEILFGGNGWDVPGTVRITYDPQGPDDDTFNTTTGEWTRVGQTTVYSGAAAFRANDPERQVDVGGGEQIRSEWGLKLPMSAPQPEAGAMVEILTCKRDPSLVGRRFKITRTLGSSFGIMRKAVMHEFVPIGNELP